jgi:hypothetical protein
MLSGNLFTGNDSLGWLIYSFIFFIISLVIQLIVGLAYIVNKRKQELGQAMLLSVGIILLVGFSVCGGFLG